MPSVQDVVNEVADNWPAFVYILLMLGFSICFLRERRRETRVLREMGERMQEGIRLRFDRLEQLVRESDQSMRRTPQLDGCQTPTARPTVK